MVFKIGVDLSDKEIKAGLVDTKGKIVKKVIVNTEADKGKEVVLENIYKAISLLLNFKAFRKTPPIGVSFPGLLNSKTRAIEQIQSLPLRGVNLRKLLKSKFKTEVEIENDGNCFVLGEHKFGAGVGLKHIIGITLGTGVGGGIIINKALYEGNNGGAGEFGQMTIKFNGMIANCGNDGSVEEYISRRGIMRLAESFGMRNINNVDEINKKAVKNDVSSMSLLREVGVYLGIHVSNLINAFDPEKVIVGGEFISLWNFFSPHMKDEIKQRAIFKTNVVKAKLGANSLVIGASCLV
ncbi:MAG: ROK family protein [Nanoarchaeota archaeon]|nr:ROK family protein [Nanoarchaeota archaeon]